jgi:hypothetical protein
VVDKVALGQAFVPDLRIFRAGIIPLMLHFTDALSGGMEKRGC